MRSERHSSTGPAETTLQRKKLALFVASLRAGGAERVMLNLARGFAGRGFKVDLVLARAEGPYLDEVPPEVRVVDLGAKRVLSSLPGLVRYLQREKPDALISAVNHVNLVALWARRLAGVRSRVVVTLHNTLSTSTRHAWNRRQKALPRLIKRFFPWADAIVAVSQGVAKDFVQTTGIAQEIHVIYNPVVDTQLFELAREPVDHPWLAPGQPPVILGIGRLAAQKDFSNLIRAFALLRQQQPARLIILGEGRERPQLEALIRQLELQDDVALPGFVKNPYAFLTRARMFVLSSQWEGLPTVLIEALALGVPIVATDCESGPNEILEGGKYGCLVPVSDPAALADAVAATLDGSGSSPDDPRPYEKFTFDASLDAYERVAGVRG